MIVQPAKNAKTRNQAPRPRIEEDYEVESIDPFQEYYDYLIAAGTALSDAWDKVWENPGRSFELGSKLAMSRQGLSANIVAA